MFRTFNIKRMNNYKLRGKKNANVMPVHLGNLLAKKIKERRYSKAAIARRINRNINAITPILKRPSMQCYLLWELSDAFKYDFFELLSEELKLKLGDKLESPNVPLKQTITELEKEIEQLRSENTYLKKAIDALAK